MKKFLLAGTSLAILVLAVIHFFSVQRFEELLETEKAKTEVMADSLLYLKYKSRGDAFMIAGDYQEAVRFYIKADSILGENTLTQENKKNFRKLQLRRDSLEKLRNKFNEVSGELVAFEDKQRTESFYKDSIIHYSSTELRALNEKVQQLKDSLSTAYQQIKKLSKSTGRLEIEMLNGTKVFYVGDITSQRANGFGYGLFSTGGLYEGEWKNNLRHGKGKYTWKDGNRYEGDYYDDKRQGKGTYYFVSGEKYIGQWMDNKRSGKGTMYGKDGAVIVSGEWKNDEIQK